MPHSKHIDQLSADELRHQVALQFALLDAAVDGVIVIDERGRIILFNAGAEELFGYSRDEALGQNVSVLMPETEAREHDRHISTYLDGEPARIIGIGRDVMARHRCGRTFPMHLSIGEAKTALGRHFVGICHDLSNYRRALQQLAQTEKRYRDIVQNQAELICRLDSRLRITFVNEAFSNALRMDDYLLMGRACTDLVHPADRQSFRAQVLAMSDGQPQPFRARLRGDDGPELWVEWRFREVSSSSQQPREYQGFGLDISAQIAAQSKADYLAAHDPLTGLLNQSAFLERCDYALRAASAEGTLSAVLFIDFYRFKWINESLGYGAGDQVLREVARRLRSHLTASAAICRRGSDEFVVLLNQITDHAEVEAAARELHRLMSAPYEVAGTTLDRTAAVGVSLYPEDAGEAADLLRAAEAAMHEAKSASQSGISFYSNRMNAANQRALKMEQGIKRALKDEQFHLVFQPKVELSQGAPVGFEALVRWSHPEWGEVSPGEFIPFAERHGLAPQIDLWVFESLCRQLRGWRDQGLEPLPVAMNLSALTFRDKHLADTIQDMTAHYDIPSGLIDLEVTEGAAMENTCDVIALLSRLRDAGFRIAIDDFGTGYSSLSYLCQLPVTCLKIDRSFVSSLEENPSQRSIVDTLVALGQALNLEVVAEGIETHVQAEHLRSRGCLVGQGFLFYRPLSAEQAQALLARAAVPAH